MGLSLAGCGEKPEIKQSFPFTVETLPVAKRIARGETVEIRCEIKCEGRYSGGRYFMRYFQPDGKGALRLDDGTVFVPNDVYELDREVFRLYYTSQGTDQQTIDLYFHDNFANSCNLTFTFNNENADKIKSEIAPFGVLSGYVPASP